LRKLIARRRPKKLSRTSPKRAARFGIISLPARREDQRCSGPPESWNLGRMRGRGSGASMPPRRECFGSAESEKIGNELAFAFHVRGEIRSSNSFPCFSYGGYKPLRTTVARGSSRLCEIFHKRSLHTSNFPASNLVNSYLVSISSAANSGSARSRNFRSCRESSSPSSLRILPALPALLRYTYPISQATAITLLDVISSPRQAKKERRSTTPL